ncbi:helix-turn-helix transcriptional regulator [Vallicoccus soli]|uniref:helix-turn-helix transcriptional regulator n=1 Tax=Vallicoccus soli TaxID=2339232 RepID=UPI003CCC73F8
MVGSDSGRGGTSPQEATGEHATRRRVARAVLEDGPSTAAALAERLDLTTAAVRRHLDALVADGTLEAREPREDRRPRGRGRPARVFAVTRGGRSAFGQEYDDLAASALEFLAGVGGDAALEAFARQRVSGLRERLVPALHGHDGEAAGERAAAVADALSAQGYAASARTTGTGAVQLCQHHCPVAAVAERFPQLCEAETEMLSGLLGTHVQRLATIAHGDGVCTTHVPTSQTSQTSPTSTTRTTTSTTATPTGRTTA